MQTLLFGFHFFGHMHGNLKGNSRSLDVGVEAWNFRLVTPAMTQKRLKLLPPELFYPFAWEAEYGA